MNWQDKIYESLVVTENGKPAKKAIKKVTPKKGDKKVGRDWPRHGKKSFHSIQDPHNDQYNNRIGTKDE